MHRNNKGLSGAFRSMAGAVLLLSMGAGAEEIGKIVIKSTSSNMKQEALEQMVLGTIGSRQGEEFNSKQVSEDIRKLIKSGNLDDVRTSTETGADGKIILTYTVSPKPVVSSITFEGNTKYKTKKLQSLIEMKTGTQLDEKQLAKDRAAVLNRYREGGYYGTEVTTRRIENEDGTINILYTVKEEERAKLKKVYFENNTVFDEDVLRDTVVTRRPWWRYIIRFGNYFDKGKLMLDKDKLQVLYAQKGYMDFAVSEVRENKVDDGKWVEVTFVLEEGRQYKINSVSLTGSQKFTAEELLGKTKAVAGAVHDSVQEQADISAMKSGYEKLGYMDLRLWATHKKDYENATVDVEYHVSEGRPSNIRNIEISGNTITRDEVVRRELTIMPGDLGDNSKVRSSKQRLMNLGYFESVDILPVSTDVPDLKDLRIDLKEKPTGNMSVGAGYSTEDSVVGFLEISENNFDLARLLGWQWPPKGDGQKIKSRFQVGSSVSNITISHVEPWFLDRRLRLSTDLFLKSRDEDEYDQRNIGVGQMLSWPVSFRIPFTDHNENWTVGTGYRVEYVDISDVDKHDPSEALTKGDFVRGRTLQDEDGGEFANRLILNLTRDTRNAFLFPSRGSRISLQGEVVGEFLGSYETYGRFDIDAAKYLPVFRDYVLKLWVDYSSTTSNDDVRIFDRYFGGGVGTIRGFTRRDVAPVDCYEDPLGGNSMFMSSAELLKPIASFMYGSIFVDAGNVWWNDFEMKVEDFNVSVGCGVQFKILPISVYYGYPVRRTYDHLDGSKGKLHFNIGMTF